MSSDVISDIIIKIRGDISSLKTNIALAKTQIKSFDNTVSLNARNIENTFKHVNSSVSASINDLSRSIENAQNRITSAVNRITKTAKILGAVLGAALSASGYKSAQSAAEMEQFAITLENLYGNAEIAAHKLAWLSDFARTTPFELPDLVEATVRLKAYGIEADRVLRILGDTAASMGKDIMMVVEALADAQTGEFERLKEFGIKAIQDQGETFLLYTDKYGKERRVQIDRNNREIITSTLLAIWNEKYAGAMEKQSQTLKGMVSNVKDALFRASLALMGWNESLASFEADSLFEKIRSVVEKILTYLNTVDFKRIGQSISSFINELSPTFKNLFSIIQSVKNIFSDLIRNMGGKENVVNTLTRAINILSGVFATLFSWLEKHPEVAKLIIMVGVLAFTFAKIVVPLIGFIQSMMVAILTIKTLVTSVGTLQLALTALGGPIGVLILAITTLGTAWALNLFGIRDATKKAFNWLVETVKWLYENWANFWRGIGEFTISVVLKIVDGIQTIINAIVSFVNRAISLYNSLVSKIPGIEEALTIPTITAPNLRAMLGINELIRPLTPAEIKIVQPPAHQSIDNSVTINIEKIENKADVDYLLNELERRQLTKYYGVRI